MVIPKEVKVELLLHSGCTGFSGLSSQEGGLSNQELTASSRDDWSSLTERANTDSIVKSLGTAFSTDWGSSVEGGR